MAGDSDIEMIVSSEMNIDKCRHLAKKHFDLVSIVSYLSPRVYLFIFQCLWFQDLHGTALFWADKVCSLSNNEPQDVYFLARCMYAMKQYRRAILVIQTMGLDKVILIMNL